MAMFKNLSKNRLILDDDDDLNGENWMLGGVSQPIAKATSGAYAPPPVRSVHATIGSSGSSSSHNHYGGGRPSMASASSMVDSDDESSYSYSGSRAGYSPPRSTSSVTSYARDERNYTSTRGRGGIATNYSHNNSQSIPSRASSTYTGSTLNQRRIIDEDKYDDDLNWRDPEDKNLFLASDAPPDVALACPHSIDVEGLFGREMRVFKRMSDNSTVHLKYDSTTHEICMWGEHALIKEAKRALERRFDYLCDNLDRIAREKKLKKEAAGRVIVRKSDIRRDEKAKKFGLVAMKELRELTDAPLPFRGVFMLPTNENYPVTRLMGPNGKPLDDLRHELGCRIIFTEQEARERIIKVAAKSYDLVCEVLSRLSIHVLKRTFIRPQLLQERMFDVMEKPMEITTVPAPQEYIPWDLPIEEAWMRNPTMLRGILSGDLHNQHHIVDLQANLESNLKRYIRKFTQYVALHDGNAKMRICLGTCLVSELMPRLQDLNSSTALKEIFVTHKALMFFSRHLSKSSRQMELFTSRLPTNYRRVDDDCSVSYTFRCEHRPATASRDPKTAWPNVKMRVWFTPEGRPNRWEAVIGERRELDLNVIYPNNDYYDKADWRLEATTWLHSPIKQDSEFGRLVNRMCINKRGQLEYSNTDMLVIQQVTRKTRILYESTDGFQLEVTRAQVWYCDPDTDGRDTPTPLIAKPTFESYGATIWPLLWKTLLEENRYASTGCLPNYKEEDFFADNCINRLVNAVHTIQNALGSTVH